MSGGNIHVDRRLVRTSVAETKIMHRIVVYWGSCWEAVFPVHRTETYLVGYTVRAVAAE